MRLLIAEDNEADVFLIRESLKNAGLDFEADIAPDGEKALALLEQSAGEPVRGIILDLNLTTHSGMEILSRLRAIPERAGLGVVILTSSDSPEDRRRAEMLGTQGYFRKPMELDAFMEMGREIAEVFRQRVRGKDGMQQP